MSECIESDTEETQPIHYQFFDQHVDTTSKPLTFKLNKNESFVSLGHEEDMNPELSFDQSEEETERSPFKSPEAAPEKGFSSVGQGSIVETFNKMSGKKISFQDPSAGNNELNGDKSSTSSRTVVNYTEMKDDEHNSSVGDKDERPLVGNYTEQPSKTPTHSEYKEDNGGDQINDYNYSENSNKNNNLATESIEKQYKSPEHSLRSETPGDQSLNEETHRPLKTSSDDNSEFSYSESKKDDARRSSSPIFEDRNDPEREIIESDNDSERIKVDYENYTPCSESDAEDQSRLTENKYLGEENSDEDESDIEEGLNIEDEVGVKLRGQSKLIVIEEKTEYSYSNTTFENYSEKESADTNFRSHDPDKYVNKPLPAIGKTNGLLELENFQKPGFSNRPHRKQPPAPIKVKLSHEQKIDAIHNRSKPWQNNMAKQQPKTPIQPVSVFGIRRAGRAQRSRPWQLRMASEITQITLSDTTTVQSEIPEKPVANAKPILRKPERIETIETKQLVRIQSSSKPRPGIPTQLKSIAYWQDHKLFVTITGPPQVIDFAKRKIKLESNDEVTMDVRMTFIQEKRKKKEPGWRQKLKPQSKAKLPPINVDRNIVENRAVYKPFQF